MTNVILGLLLCLGSNAKAAVSAYALKIDVSVNGTKISSPKLQVVAGEKASIMQKKDGGETYIEVVANDVPSSPKNLGRIVKMEFSIWSVDGNATKTLISRPSIMALENEQAQITVGDSKNPGEELSLSVTATRKAL